MTLEETRNLINIAIKSYHNNSRDTYVISTKDRKEYILSILPKFINNDVLYHPYNGRYYGINMISMGGGLWRIEILG